MLRSALAPVVRVPGVADGVVAGERRQRRRGEHVGHEPGVLVQARPAAVADRDAGGLLAAVLQGEQPEEGELGDPSPCGVDMPSTPHSSCGRSSAGSCDWPFTVVH